MTEEKYRFPFIVLDTIFLSKKGSIEEEKIERQISDLDRKIINKSIQFDDVEDKIEDIVKNSLYSNDEGEEDEDCNYVSPLYDKLEELYKTPSFIETVKKGYRPIGIKSFNSIYNDLTSVNYFGERFIVNYSIDEFITKLQNYYENTSS